MKDISEVCQITPEGRVLRGDVKDATHFAFKGGNAINDKLKTRYDILFAVYMATNKSAHEFSNMVFTSEIDNAVTDTINKIDKGNDYHTVSDTVLSHCCDEANSNLMSMFETEFNQKLIFGSSFLGIGWGMIGLCPGPAISSITFFQPRAGGGMTFWGKSRFFVILWLSSDVFGII
jgi:hypothetical protein